MSEKLIRYGLANTVEGHGTLRYEIGNAEWVRLLRAKLLEEAAELALAQFLEEIVSEMVDVLDVIEGMKLALGITDWQVRMRQVAKCQDRGDFTRPMAWDPEGKR
jgi:predicted house-cleaning noncanonical NTP pyrophosphatase (MazG superfamily)